MTTRNLILARWGRGTAAGGGGGMRNDGLAHNLPPSVSAARCHLPQRGRIYG